MKINISPQQLDTVVSYADGSFRVQKELEISKHELDDSLLDHNIEECPNCHWYTDSFNLLSDGEDDPDGYCDNCRKYDK